MRIKPLVIVIGIVSTMILAEANFAEARGVGSRGGTSVRLGISRGTNSTRQYFGPRFYTAPQIGGSYGSGSRYQMRQWYYSRSGPIEYYRPANPLYRTR